MHAEVCRQALPSHMQQEAVLCCSRLPLSVLSTNICLEAPPTPAVHSQPPQGVHSGEDAVEDVWTLVRPGHVREKIAIFSPEGAGHTHIGPTHSERTTPSLQRERTPNIYKWTGREAPPLPSLLPWQPSSDEREEPKVSVGEMVAFLEQRASEAPVKPQLTLRRSSACITLSRAPPTDVTETNLDGARVSAIVARLEAVEGVSRRAVGRVQLAAVARSEPISCWLRMAPPPQAPPLLSEVDNQSLSTSPQEVEPLPGLLFLTTETRPPADSSQSGKKRPSEQAASSRSASCTGDLRTGEAPPPASAPGPLSHTETRPLADTQSGKRRRCEGDVIAGSLWCPSFLEARCRVQALLEPPPLLWLLPPHLLLLVLRLLPTRSLAALKCTCSYLQLLIEAFAVRPVDSLWVSDPRYRDDPCKQCKRRYTRGDVSLCRWHAKPYCQALPFGPGYWMCCRRSHREAPGCHFGLHDNRWVPPCHSINAPLHRRATVE